MGIQSPKATDVSTKTKLLSGSKTKPFIGGTRESTELVCLNFSSSFFSSDEMKVKYHRCVYSHFFCLSCRFCHSSVLLFLLCERKVWIGAVAAAAKATHNSDTYYLFILFTIQANDIHTFENVCSTILPSRYSTAEIGYRRFNF